MRGRNDVNAPNNPCVKEGGIQQLPPGRPQDTGRQRSLISRYSRGIRFGVERTYRHTYRSGHAGRTRDPTVRRCASPDVSARGLLLGIRAQTLRRIALRPLGPSRCVGIFSLVDFLPLPSNCPLRLNLTGHGRVAVRICSPSGKVTWTFLPEGRIASARFSAIGKRQCERQASEAQKHPYFQCHTLSQDHRTSTTGAEF